MGKRFYYNTLLENFPATLGEATSMALTPPRPAFPGVHIPRTLGVFQQRGPLSPTSLRNGQRRLSERFRPQIGCRQVEWETPPCFGNGHHPGKLFSTACEGGLSYGSLGLQGLRLVVFQ